MRQNIPCYNLSQAGPGRVMMFAIPCGRRGQFLCPRASYLNFRVNNTGTTAFNLDYSAHAFISRLEVYHGSNLLERISDYNVLVHLLKDITSSLDHNVTVGSALEGIATGSSREGDPIATAAS